MKKITINKTQDEGIRKISTPKKLVASFKEGYHIFTS